MTDRLVFRGAGGDLMTGWRGPWPPPGRLIMLTDEERQRAALIDPDDPQLDPRALPALLARGLTARPFRLVSASQVAEPAPAEAPWFRGALYEPGEPS